MDFLRKGEIYIDIDIKENSKTRKSQNIHKIFYKTKIIKPNCLLASAHEGSEFRRIMTASKTISTRTGGLA